MINRKSLINILDDDSTSILSYIDLLNNKKNNKIQILSIGSIFSGTNAFSKDALIGLNELLIERKNNNNAEKVI